jgi:hypothetical protein
VPATTLGPHLKWVITAYVRLRDDHPIAELNLLRASVRAFIKCCEAFGTQALEPRLHRMVFEVPFQRLLAWRKTIMSGKKSLLSTVASVGLVLALAGPVTIAPPNVGPALAQADTKVQISLDSFHDRLAPDGDWVEYEDGHVWVPNKVAAGWQPYTRGHWVFAKGIGWTWVSDEPWGWATYHYGRWGYKDDIGWYWVPGTVWAPAWVSWRKSNKHVAWAPLPPKRHEIYVDADVDFEPEEIPTVYWRVVPVEAFISTNLAAEIIDEDEAEAIIHETRPVGAVRVRKNIVVNDVIEPEFIEKEAKTKVVVHEVRQARDVDEADKVSEREVVIFDAPIERETAKSWKPKETKSIDEVRTERKAGLTEDKGKAAVGEEMPTGDKAAKAKTDEMKAKEEEKARVETKTKTDEMSSEGATAATPGQVDETTLEKKKAKTEEMKVKEESATKDEDKKVKEESAKTKIDDTTVKEESAKAKVEETKVKEKSAKAKPDEATESETLKTDQGQAEGKSEQTTKRKKASSAAAQDSDSSATGAVGSDEAKKPAKKEKKKGGAAEGATEKAPEEQLPQQ